MLKSLLYLCLAVALAAAAPAQALDQPAGGPTVFDITPTHVHNGIDSQITITGVGFVATPIVALRILDNKPILLAGVELTTPTTVRATVPGATPEGIYAVTVYNPDGSHSDGTAQRLTVVRPGDQHMSSWAQTAPMELTRNSFVTIAAAGNLYAIGGYSGDGHTAMRNVERAQIAADGTLGPWQPASQLTQARGDFAAVVSGDYIYAIGGATAAGIPTVSTVERARVNPDGSLGTWELISNLPEVRFRPAAAVVGDYLVIMDGWAAWGGPYNPADTLQASINPDGSLGPWSAAAPTTGRSQSAAAWGAFIYALNEDGTIERSALRPDGTLAPWVNLAATAGEHRYGALAVLNQNLLVLGGMAGSYPNYASLNSVERAAIKADGSLGAWALAPSLLSGHAFFSVGVWGEMSYAAGSGYMFENSRAVEFSRALHSEPTERLYLPLARR